jgi:hypothetical protein
MNYGLITCIKIFSQFFQVELKLNSRCYTGREFYTQSDKRSFMEKKFKLLGQVIWEYAI